MAGEFDLIARYFHRPGSRGDVALGVGDDCALLRVPPGKELAVSVDTMVEGVHYPPGTSASDVGWKLAAVNLSDLAAMGAEPAWATLALTLPEANETWLAGFAEGLHALLDRYRVALVGGDTTRGPRTLSLQIHGLVPTGQALRRSGARPGDGVYVSGTLGDAGFGLRLALGDAEAPAHARDFLLARLNRPTPRVELGEALRGLATAAIDISDGLAQDLGHLLHASGVGAVLDWRSLPLSSALRLVCGDREAWSLALTAGDDYELCFTAPDEQAARLQGIADALGLALTRIGHIRAEAGLALVSDGETMALPERQGFQHF